nr:ATP-binding cassette domain-containing protein [Desulfobacterales bacterium]
MIEIKNLTKRFGGLTAINNISFHVAHGEILGFLGPNGAGKTTTIRILTGFFPPTSGSAKVDGLDVFDDSLEVRKRLGYLPENVPLYNDMRVSSYLGFAASLKGVPKERGEKEVDRVINTCGLQPVRDRFIGKISKGFRQRVGIAQAIIGDPDVLILDEPTVGLDPKQIIEIRELIRSFSGQKTVILSSHILPEVSMTCGRVVIINEGRIVAEDTPENLTGKDSSRVMLEIEGPDKEIVEKLRTLHGVTNVSVDAYPGGGSSRYTVEMEKGKDVRGLLAQSVVESGWRLLEMRSSKPSLEDVFIRLVTEEVE